MDLFYRRQLSLEALGLPVPLERPALSAGFACESPPDPELDEAWEMFLDELGMQEPRPWRRLFREGRVLPPHPREPHGP